ncbi:MurR/RpiR family transcriptional regulator [Virgibacillus doumboii]|uniref:MurR/RpiR family transcriptional regulator n=1 Tax=Virgibacillus doumboii TaxID=2697503 RepID=UPI0013E07625|nr:MurR/RpiR family transcriptional regulator [Virgibacillus doumboii]
MESSKIRKAESIRMGCLTRIKGVYSSLRPSEQQVANEILNNPNEVIYFSVGEFSKKCNVSEATIIRFCKAIDFDGFQKFKLALAQDLTIPTQFIPEEISKNDDIKEVIGKVSHSNLQAIKDTNEIIDKESVEHAAEIICNARKIEIYGVGFSGLVAQDFGIRLSRIGFLSFTHVDPHLQANSASLLSGEDVAIGISLLGRTKDIYYSLEQAKRAGATTISLTKYNKNIISDLTDVNLHTTFEEKGNFRTGASRIAQLHLLDILFTRITIKRYETALENIEKTKHVSIDKRM